MTPQQHSDRKIEIRRESVGPIPPAVVINPVTPRAATETRRQRAVIGSPLEKAIEIPRAMKLAVPPGRFPARCEKQRPLRTVAPQVERASIKRSRLPLAAGQFAV